MGGMMTSMAACCACNAASCACSAACSCLGSYLAKSTATRAYYVVLFFITSFFALILNFWGEQILSWVPTLSVCTPADGTAASNSGCYGVLAVYRICFGLTLFHLIFALILINVKDSKDPRAGLQDGWWLIKILIWAVFIVIAFVIPNGFYSVYGYIAFIGAGFFIIVQLILLIDMAYTWTEKWRKNYEENDDSRWLYALLVCTLIIYAAAITGIALEFVYFGDGDRSSLNLGITIFEIIACVFLSFMSVTPKIQEALPSIGLLQSSVVTFYTTYLIGSAFLSEPCPFVDETQCSNHYYSTSSGGQITSMIIGGLFTIFSVCYSTVRAAGSVALGQEKEGLLDNAEEGEAGSTTNTEGLKDDEEEAVTYSYSFFHIMFATASMYICQLLTNWSIVSSSESATSQTTHYVDNGMAAVWVKIVSSWIALLLYAWTMAAPLCFPDREW